LTTEVFIPPFLFLEDIIRAMTLREATNTDRNIKRSDHSIDTEDKTYE